jgi:MarR family transcriptional regulator, organic hydroperoxide resistance regulator
MNYEQTLGRQSGVLYYLLSKRLNTLLAEAGLGITVDQFRLLTMLWKEDGITQQQLADKLGRDRAGVTRMTDILEEQGVLVRVADKNDRRVNLLHLTKKGREIEPLAAAAAQRALDEMTKDFSTEEKSIFAQLHQRAIRNLGS